MKPAFALDLRDDAIGLLHRSGKTWQQVGGVSMDEPDLTGALSYLRASALGLSPRGVTTKLIIPNDQILYTTVSAPGPDDESRRTQIRAALEGRTPYAPEDLVFDWSGSGDEVQVAVLARETLDEAEGFAAKHRFNPISFVAVPDEGTFEGEPWFGPTALSVSLLSGSEKVERDNLAVLDIRRNLEADIDAADHPMFDAVLVQPDTAEVSVTTEAEVTTEPAEAAIVEPVADAAPIELADAVIPEPPVNDQIAFAEPQPVPAQTLSDVILPLAATVVEEAPMALDVAPDDDGPAKDINPESDAAPRPSVTDPGIKDDGGSASSLTTAMAFASRRNPDHAPKVARPPGVRPLAAEKPAAPRASIKPTVAKPESLDAAGKPRKKNGIDTTVAPVLKPAIAPAAAPIAVPKAATTTGLGSRAPAPVKRKTRSLGLILTAVLLLFLALVAAWSSIFLASDDTVPTADPVQTSDMAPLPTEDEEMLADQQDPAEFEANTPAAVPADQTAEAPADAPATEPDAAEPQVAAPPPIAPSSAEAAPANAAQPSEQPQDEIVLATMDAPPATESPTSLPAPEARGDSLPTSQAAPPPFGTTYQFDANGLIKPTEQGIITPEGVTLYAGKPPLLPPARPAALAAAAPAPAVAPAPPAAETPVVAETPVDPALAKARPRARPANLGGTAAHTDTHRTQHADGSTPTCPPRSPCSRRGTAHDGRRRLDRQSGHALS
jgi:hypothetical protein